MTYTERMERPAPVRLTEEERSLFDRIDFTRGRLKSRESSACCKGTLLSAGQTRCDPARAFGVLHRSGIQHRWARVLPSRTVPTQREIQGGDSGATATLSRFCAISHAGRTYPQSRSRVSASSSMRTSLPRQAILDHWLSTPGAKRADGVWFHARLVKSSTSSLSNVGFPRGRRALFAIPSNGSGRVK